jgi:hypothetical protein
LEIEGEKEAHSTRIPRRRGAILVAVKRPTSLTQQVCVARSFIAHWRA